MTAFEFVLELLERHPLGPLKLELGRDEPLVIAAPPPDADPEPLVTFTFDP